MIWVLHRIYLPTATLGVMRGGPHPPFFVLEDVDRGNRPDSCVREGEYTFVPHHGVKYKDTFALVGGNVVHEITASKNDREFILIHWGNKTSDTLGCLLVGEQARLDPEPMVLESAKAFARWLSIMKSTKGPHQLIIRQG